MSQSIQAVSAPALARYNRRSAGPGRAVWIASEARAVSFSISLGNGDWLQVDSPGACPPFQGKVGGFPRQGGRVFKARWTD